MDIIEFATRMKDEGIDAEKILSLFSKAKEDGKITDEEIAEIEKVVKVEAPKDPEEHGEEKEAEKAFGMKFLD